METIELFQGKIHVQKGNHHIMIPYEHMDNIHLENGLLFLENISLEMDTNKYDIDLLCDLGKIIVLFLKPLNESYQSSFHTKYKFM